MSAATGCPPEVCAGSLNLCVFINLGPNLEPGLARSLQSIYALSTLSDPSSIFRFPRLHIPGHRIHPA